MTSSPGYSVMRTGKGDRGNHRLLLAAILSALMAMAPSCQSFDYRLPENIDTGRDENNPSNAAKPLISAYESQLLRAGKRNREVLAAIAISGGGHRSANFGVGVLAELEELGILGEIDYLSTVSGGGFAAAAYLTTLLEHIEKTGSSENYRLRDILEKNHPMREHLSHDYKGTLLRGLFFSPRLWFRPHDRGELLEEKIDDLMLGRKRRDGRSITLRDIFRYRRGEAVDARKMVPYWITNATVFNDGAIFPFSPQVLELYGVTRYTHRTREEALKDSPGDMPVSVGVCASASFPVGVPPVTLRCRKTFLSRTGEKMSRDDLFLHLTDGGCSDNLGIRSAVRMLREGELQSLNNGGTRKKKVLIVIDAYGKRQFPYSGREGEPNEPAVILRTMEIGLDAQHVDIEDTLSQKYARGGITVVYLGLGSTDSDGGRSSLEKIYRSLVAEKKIAAGDEKARKEILDGPRSVSTDFDVTVAQQWMLIETGRKAVRDREKILTPLFR